MDSVKQDAREFGLHLKQGGWRLGLLVARNVEKGKGQGARLLRDHEEVAKVSAVAFARAAGTTADRVLRHLDAWEKAALAGHVKPAEQLSPGQEIRLNVANLPDWDEFYDASKVGGGPGPALIGRMSKAQKVKLAQELTTDPAVAKDVAKKLAKEQPSVIVEAATDDPITKTKTRFALDASDNAAKAQGQSERKARKKGGKTQDEIDAEVLSGAVSVIYRVRQAWADTAQYIQDNDDRVSVEARTTLREMVSAEEMKGAEIAAAIRGDDLDAELARILSTEEVR